MRKIAILTDGKHVENVNRLIEALSKVDGTESVAVFASADGVEGSVRIPSDMDTETKRRNWVNKRYSGEGFTGFLHVISETTELTADPSKFLSDLELMMSTLDYSVWFNTVCDGCNYVYRKYNPRMSIRMDRPDVVEKTGMGFDINFTSHSNSQWIAYDFSRLSGSDLLRFDEDFTVPMFWIIEFLARRRNTRTQGDLYFMNWYMTVGSERGVFRTINDGTAAPDDQEAMKREDAIFKQKAVNHTPDQSLDVILEDFWKKLGEKAGIAV